MTSPADQSTSLGEVLARAGVDALPASEGNCFLSVVMRTQGRRPRLLAEALARVAEQTDRDFDEVIVVRHRTEPEAAGGVDAVVTTNET